MADGIDKIDYNTINLFGDFDEYIQDIGVVVSTTYPLAVNQLHLTLGGELTTAQLDWLVANPGITQQLNDFITEQSFSDEAKAFAVDALELMRLNPDITLDVSRSFNAPFLIDLSEVLPDDDPATDEVDKETLMHVYNKLIETDSFKDLFTDVFGPDSPYTVKFKIGNNALDCSSSTAIACTKYSIVSINGVPTRIKDKLITITFDSDKLQLNSFISVARTIIHEAIHANLALLKIEDEDATLPYNSEFTVEVFADLLLERFGASDHLFMANYYRPILRQNLQEILPLLYLQTRIDEIGIEPVSYTDENDVIEFLENWNWNNFWQYFPWAGLHNTTEFMGQIGTNTLYNKLFEAYYDKAQKFGRDLPE